MTDEFDWKPDQSSKPKERTDNSTRGTAESHRNSELWSEQPSAPEALTGENSSLEQRRACAKEALPDRFHDLIDKSEVYRVMSAEEYNREHRSAPDEGALSQLPARETGHLSVVEMKLGDSMPAGQAHGSVERIDGSVDPHIGRWFGEYAPDGRTPAQIKEDFALPPGSEKTLSSWGSITAGSTVVISEVNSRSFTLDEWNASPHAASNSERDREASLDRLMPALRERPDVSTYQIELKGDPSREFEIKRSSELKRDRLH